MPASRISVMKKALDWSALKEAMRWWIVIKG
jgi:hypothetical protein